MVLTLAAQTTSKEHPSILPHLRAMRKLVSHKFSLTCQQDIDRIYMWNSQKSRLEQNFIIFTNIILFFLFTVKALLDKGADPNQKDILGNTPLHLGKGSPVILMKQLAIDFSGDLTVRVLLLPQIYTSIK